MRYRALYYFISIVFLTIINFSPLLSQETTGPRILFEEKIFNSKSVQEGNKVEHTFIISNSGDETLKIEKVEPG